MAAENLCKILERLGDPETSHQSAAFYDRWCIRYKKAMLITDKDFAQFVLRLIRRDAMRSLSEDNKLPEKVKTHLGSMITTRYRQHFRSFAF